MAQTGKTRRIVVTRNGPYLVTGGVPMLREVAAPDDEGDPVEWKHGKEYPHRDGYSLCRCGHSGDKPYCDGSHIRSGFKDQHGA